MTVTDEEEGGNADGDGILLKDKALLSLQLNLNLSNSLYTKKIDYN